MEKVQLMILGLSASPASNNAYALILKEVDGERRLPIIIGAFEAQAIVMEIEGVKPPRPMTHDLICRILDQLETSLSEVYINKMVDGTFYAQLIFDLQGIEVDARPSDAIAIAVRCNAPIYISNDILEETGLIPQNEESPDTGDYEDDLEMKFLRKDPKSTGSIRTKSRIEIVQSELEKAIKDENYEKAATLRDELKKLSGNQ